MTQHTIEKMHKCAQNSVKAEKHSQHHRAGVNKRIMQIANGLAHKVVDAEVCTKTGEGREIFAASKGWRAQAVNENGNNSAHNGGDAEVCTGTGKVRETFVASNCRGAQADNVNGTAHKGEDAKACTETSK